MQFELTQEQKELQALTRDFSREKIAPSVAERDENETFTRNLYHEMGLIGLTRLCFPKKDGGTGQEYLSFIVAVEELSKVDDSLAACLSASVLLCQWPIYQYGTQEQKQTYLKPLLAGKKLGAFGLTEPNAGSDASRQQTTAVRQDDHYLLNGKKIFITNGGEAETYVIFAMTAQDKGVKGISAFIVEKGMPGFTFGKTLKKMGSRGSLTRELIFENVKIPIENLLGKEEQGFKIAMTTLDGGRLGVAAQAIGIGQASLDYAIEYAKRRVQFGKSISENQGISFMLADMKTKVDAARLLTYRAVSFKDKGLPYMAEAAMAKMYASDMAMSVATDSVQIFGGYGFSREYPVERLMRNAKITQIYEGTNQVQRMVIASNMLR
jgi:butyryl-CoA dehydrogenase